MNNKYIRYLFKNRKVAAGFFLVLYLGMSLTSFIGYREMTVPGLKNAMSSSLEGGLIMSMILAFVLPVVQFGYVHSKKSTDLYFSLPVSRKDQLIGNLFFCFILPYGYYLINAVLTYILGRGHAPLMGYLGLVLLTGVYILVIVLTTSLLFLLANNLFDGIVMIGAYSALPLLIYVVYNTFVTADVAGMTYSEFTLAGYFSPLYMCAHTYGKVSSGVFNAGESIDIGYAVLPVIYGALAAWRLKYHFIDRQAERAEQLSDYFFAYPFVIHIYAFLILLVFGFEFHRSGHAAMLVFYLLLLFIYIVATFVYKRKIEIKPKYLIRYAVGMAVTILVGIAGFRTQGFGLAQKNPIDQGKYLHYSYSANAYCSDLGEGLIYGTDDYEEGCAVNMNLEIPVAEFDQNRELLNKLEETRQKDISAYYNDLNGDRYGTREFYNNDYSMYTNGYAQWNSASHRIYMISELYTEEELKYFAQYGDIQVWPFDHYEECTLDEFLRMRGK